MTTSTAKNLGLTTARKWFIATEVPHIDDAVKMMTPNDGDSPSWHDIVDVFTMAIDDGVLHIEAAIVTPMALELINVNAVMMPG